MSARTRSFSSAPIAFVLGVALTLLTFRHGRLLTFDGYYYCEFAKQFTTAWPDRFGYHWPVGYPLAGALLARAGTPAYLALVMLSALSLAVLLAVASRIPSSSSPRWPVLIAIAAAPVIAPQLGGVLTELPFAAVWLLLAFCLSRWPARGALWGAALCAVLAFCIRYAGIIALAVIAAWGAVQWTELRRARRLGHALGAWLIAAAIVGALLAINVVTTGHASGAGRGVMPGFALLPGQLADFGWSLPSALIAGGLRDRIGTASPAGLALGGLFFVAIVALCARAWFRPRTACSRPLALVTLGYAGGMAVLRCVGEFDALYNARTFLPVLAPVLLLIREVLADWPAWSMAACVAVFAAGATAATRGISREIGGDVRLAVAPLRAAISSNDRIAVNDHAFALSAYFHQPVVRALLGNWRNHPVERFVVVAGKPTARDGRGARCPDDWAAFCAELVQQQRYRYLVREPHLIALERVSAAP